jgi:preprotein translocase subunit YajC
MLLYDLIEMVSSLQPEATGGGGGGGAGGGGGGSGPGPGPASCATNIGLLGVLLVAFYFLLIRPQKKQQQQHQEMLKSLRRGDVVRTTGGLRGEITDLNERDVTLLVADKVKVNVLRSHISGRDQESEGSENKSEKNKD